MTGDQNRAREFQTRLLGWYHAHKRDLPWRRSTDPYAIWISEIMAQQTRITALLPYYERFMARFPDVRSLAAADEQEVLAAWAGLGYYSRARSLHRAARQVVAAYDGTLPCDEAALRTLPGIGAYTAGAIMSIAFGVPAAAVDGNVLRVYARVQHDRQDISTPKAKADAAAFVDACMSADEPGCFTQALMELGALVCLPGNPQCLLCPVQPLCRAFEAGEQASLPHKPPKKEKKQKDVTVLLLFNTENRVLMRRRTQPLLRGMWEFVTLERAMSEADVVSFLSEKGVPNAAAEEVGAREHVFTHIIWHMRGYRCAVPAAFSLPEHVWVGVDDLLELALPAAFKGFSDALAPGLPAVSQDV